jgi:hypothetical protein
MYTVDLSRIRFSDHETMVPSRGWSGGFHTFTAFCLLQPRLGIIVSWFLLCYIVKIEFLLRFSHVTLLMLVIRIIGTKG